MECLFPFEFQRFDFRHKLIYIALTIPIFLLFRSIYKNVYSIIEKDNLIFILLVGTLLIFITHQLMTINGLYIFFLIPVFAGFSHVFSKDLKKKKYLINFFLILSLISTIYYHQKYISKRDTLLLRESDLSKSVNAKVLSNKLKNLRWLTHHYPNDPNYEIKNLIETMKIIEKIIEKK